MILVIIKARVTRPECAKELCRVYRQTIERSQRPGWVRGRCFVNSSDRQQVVFVEEWGSRTAFDAWVNSPRGVYREQQFAQLIVGTYEIEVYEEA